MATLKIRMVIGLMALLIGGLGLEGYAHGLTGDRTPAGRQYNVCNNYAQGLSVAGNLPVTANVTAVPVKAAAPDGQPSVAAFDITITNGGREWQPAPGDPVFVTLTDRKFVDGKLLDIYHQGPDGPEFVGTVMPENGTITFPAYSFSVYIVTESGPEARLTVNFHQADGTTVKTIYVKPNDIDASNDYVMFNKVVYDPGSGAIPDGTTFRGWTKDNPYTVESVQNAMTIEGVREDIKDILTPSSGEFTATSVDYYALVYKSFSVTYVDESSSNVVIAIDNRIAMPDATSISYTVYQPYTPEEDFSVVSGWTILEGSDNITGYSTTPIGQNTTVTLMGNVTLKAAVETGRWLIFDENGKGATYNAPMFVKWGTNAICPQHATAAEMQCYGYSFDGWYNGYYNDDDGDPSTPPQKVLTTPFTGFGQPLTENTTIFAKWVPNVTADYTIMIWKQNTARNGYDFAASYSGTGTVGQGIAAQAITTGTTGDLTYVTIDGTKYGGITSVATGTTTDPFTGFTLSTVNPIQDVIVTVDGNNVVNVYFDRVRYTLKMYVTRTNNSGNQPYGSSSGSSSNNTTFYGNWNTELDYITRINGSAPTTYDMVSSYRYYYHTIEAYYGDDISALWLDYADITSSTTFVSWILMPTAKAFVSNTSGQNTVKGTISIMDEQILGDLSDADGNFVTARYGSPNNWTYYIYFADADGNYPSTPNKTLILKSQGTNASTQHAPAYDGYTYHHYTGGTAVSSGNYTISYYYTPNLYSINFMDGLYVSGTGNPGQTVQNKSSNQLSSVSNVTYGAALDSYNYTPALPTGEEGYMFEGWYTDKACTSPFNFEGTTMPLGGITIYAKWRQIRYRVFLHPNVPESDESLSWGGSSQAMNFGIAYGNKLSAPTGTRDNYVFVGWFKDQALSEAFNADAYVLNDETVPETPAYDKTTDFTDPMNEYGNITDYNSAYNSDLNRPYVTRKLDLYAKWRAIIEGADGINVTYDPGAGTLSTTDDKLYKDNTNAIGLPASTPTDNNLQFSYWEVLHYDETAGDYVSTEKFVYPGGPFAVLKDDAKKEQIGTDEYKYTVKLIAHYEPKEVQTLTFIKWYLNYNTPDSVYRLDNNLVINANVSIPEAPTREGYNFKGWYKQRTETGNVPTIVTVTGCNPNFLYYNDGNYYSDASFTTVASYVAADEANLYDYLYAVWEPEITLSDATGCGTATLSVAEITGASCQWYSVTTSGETEISGATGFSYNAPASGTYKVVVTDAAGCTVSATAQATVSEAPTVTLEGFTTCATTSGSHTLQPTVTNASGTVTYRWDDATTTSSLEVSTVTPGTYPHTVTVQDARECPVTVSATVTVNANPTIAIDTTRESCAGNDGTAEVHVSGGVTPYTYVWTDGSTTVGTAAKAEGLTSLGTNNGRYYVTVTDAYGCTASADTVIELYNPLVLNPMNVTFCAGYEFTITPENGVGGNVLPTGTTFTWNAPENSNVESGLNAGTEESSINTVIELKDWVTDPVIIVYNVEPVLNRCVGDQSTVTVTVNATINPTVTVEMVNALTKCSNDENFTLTANFTNVNSVHHVVWKAGGESGTVIKTETEVPTDTTVSTSPAIDLIDGKCDTTYTYRVEYTDVTGCTASDECVITVNSGTWSIGKPDGSSTVACVSEISQPTPPTNVKDSCGRVIEPEMTYTDNIEDDLACNGNGTRVYTFRYTACDGSHKDWTYTYTIKDTVKPNLKITNEPTAAAAGNCQYSIPELTYTVSDCNTYTVTQFPDKEQLCDQRATAYDTTITLTATDACGNDSVLTYTVTIPAKPAVEITVPTEDVCPAAEFTVTANITSGAPDYSYIWNNVPNSIEYANTMGTVSTSTITATVTAYGCNDTKNVKIEVTDANGCVAEASTTVKVKRLDQPTITYNPTGSFDLGCNPAAFDIPVPAETDYTISDECGNGTFGLTHGEIVEDGCNRSQTHIATYRNKCGNSAKPDTVTYTWTVDTEAPVIADIPDQTATPIGSCKYQIPDLSTITLNKTTETCNATFVSQSRLSTEEIEQTDAQQTIVVTVTVKDDCGNEATKKVNVIIPAKSETIPAITLGDSVVCSGGSVTMKPTVTPTGYTYNWTWKEGTNTVASTQNYSVTPTATTTYTVSATATTDNGCELEASKTVTVTVNDVAEATINGNDFCQGGSTTLSVPAGASAYVWAKDGTTITGANTNELNVTEAGTYTVTVTAEGGCTSVGSKTVKMNPLPTVTINNVPQLCPSTTSYTLGCQVTGTEPFTYTWSSASTDLTLDDATIAAPTATFPAVCDGSYTVKLVVTDKNNCSSNEASRTITVKDETTPTITLSQTSVNATPVAGCTYQVPDVTTLVTVSDACTKQELVVTQSPAATTVITATQDVTVTVSDGCHTNTATIRVVVPDAMALTATEANIVNPLCHGDNNGSITVNAATGGTPAYTYAIDGGTASTALTFSGLAAGNHTITATDAYGCTATLTVTLTEPDVLTATVTTTQETCTGHDGKATVSANGGTEGYTFEWSNGATGTNQDTLTSFGPNHGVYTVTVTDAHNCHANATATITLNNPLTMNELSTVVCSGYEFSITPVNGTDGNLPAGTTYTWEAPSATANPDVASGLAGATDADRINGTITLNSDVTHPVNIVYAVTPENGVCVGEATNVSVTVNATVNPKVTITIPHHLNKCNSGTYDLTAEFVNGYSAYDVVWLRNGDTIASSKKHNEASVTYDVFSVNLDNTSCGSEYVYRVAYTDESGCTAADECKISITSGTWSIGTPDGSATVACLADATAPIIPNTVVDSCGREITGVLLKGYPQDSPTIITCNGTRTYKYRYTACDGSYNDWTYTYTIKDTVKPNLLITSTPAPEAAGNCQYKIPAVVYTASDCNTYTVTQTPAANETVDQEATAKTVEITLTAKDACGNDSVVKTTVTIPAKPTVEATVNPAAICLNENATVSATVTGTTATPTWTVVPATGTVSGNTFTATADGLYTLTASVTENGCTVSDDATVTVNPLATLNITDAATKQEQLISYGTNIDPVEITNTESNVTLTPAYGTSDWPAGFEYNETTQVITSNLPAAGIYTFVAKATSLYGCDPVTQTIKVTVTEDSNPIVIRSSTKEWTYDGETHTDEVYTVTYNGANMAVDATGKVFTLPTGDKVTITPTAAGVTHVDSYSENNTYTYTIEHGTQYTSVTTFVGTLSINCRKVTLTSCTDSKTYDGTELKKETVTVAGDGWLTGKEATYSNFASVTYVSSIENTFDYALAAGENADDYCVTVNNGTLTVTDGTTPGDTPVEPALVVNKTASTTDSYALGETVTFTVSATNIYAEPKTITFTELPNVTLSQSTFTEVAAGQTVTATATYTITEADILNGTFTNTVTAQLGNITKTADKTVETDDPNGHLTVTKTTTSTPADGTKYNLGETISYNVKVTNDGNLTITDITVTDPLTGGSWTVATLAPGADQTFTTSYTVTEVDILAGHVLNVATAAGTSPDPEVPSVPVTPGSVDEPTGTAPLVIKVNATKVYDGTPLQVPFDAITDVTTTGLMTGDALTAGSVISSGSAVGTYTYTSGDATINMPFNTALGIDYYTVTYEINLTITKKALLIELDSTKVYDGTKFTVTYDQLYTTGLVDGDYLASGNMWTESYQYNDTTYSGIHVGEYENNDGSFEAVEAIVGYVAKAGFSVKDAGGSVVTASYVPKFKVKLKIVKRPITITAASDSKPYDGTDLTNSGHSITSGALATGDSYTATVTGAQLCKGTKNNVPSGAVITRGTEDVTADYTISYENGTLTVTDVDPGQFICPTAETFELNDCETSTSVTLVGTPTVTGVAAGKYTVVNDLVNPLNEGTHTITWSLLDDCGNEVGSCTQDVTVKYKECTGVTWQGHPYDAVRIGSQCWFTENLQWNTGSAVAYGEDAANVGKFGYLYTWYTAVGVPENDNTTAPTTQNDDCGNPYVQGICPPGWAVGSQADYDLLNTTAGSTSNLKDPSTEYWQAGYEGVTGGTGFNARGGGWYNSALSRYEDIMTGYHFWNSDSNPGTTVNSSTIVYYCDEILTVQAQKTDKMSVRCIRKKQ